MEPRLTVNDVHQEYEGKPLLDGITFSLEESETLCLLGASGSGKSTLLRIIAGLEVPASGLVYWNGKDLVNIPAHKRNFGLMFQDYALFPFMTVEENIAFGLYFQDLDQNEINVRVAEVLDTVGLGGFKERNVINLSGGEQQRVALARTLAPQPSLLMLDEPLGALDHDLKVHLMSVLRRILRKNKIPAIYVTHDQEEAFALADRILILNNGKIVRSGSPHDLWENPGSAWTANFLGLGNILSGSWVSAGKVDTKLGILTIRKCNHDHQPGDRIDILIRPDTETGGLGQGIKGIVEDVQFTRKGFKVLLASGLFFFRNSSSSLGEIITVNIPSDGVICLG